MNNIHAFTENTFPTYPAFISVNRDTSGVYSVSVRSTDSNVVSKIDLPEEELAKLGVSILASLNCDVKTRITELEDLLRSAGAIAARKGEDTAWTTFENSLRKAGIGSVTPRVYRNPRP